MAPIGKIYSYPNNPRVAKALIAARYNGLEVEVPADFTMETFKSPENLKKFPLGKVPVFEGADGFQLFESSAIAYYVAAYKENTDLLGATAAERALVQQWILFADNEVNNNFSAWFGPLMGYQPYLKPSVDAAIEKVTFADICVATSLVGPYKMVFDKEFRAQYKNVNRYFNTLINQPHFKAVVGDIPLCETALKYTPPKKEKKPAAEQPKKEKKAEPKKEKKPEAAEEADEPKPEPKPKSALDLLPPSPFVMDAWKRMYSNNDTDVAMKWFWENHDPQGFSLWKVDYKYNDELTQTFMSNNLIGGFYARLERAHKYAFGSMIVRGTNNNNTISGYWLIRGQEVPFEIYDAADYESYNFTKVEPAQYEEKKKEIEDYMSWNFEDLADGKIFK
ncbi:hypothetical protein K450DRAFT_252049 [Umbelopsis ramanniana AG]|uniref:Elongation factor 1-gamma n=1 Tax=Umbelopsis ramanniana AG TaxID=1314678 RepID=A0AAD5HAW8_UMBRA|nr:uncharacterized protein K450DRAFT_252049 [Umbelopsis ramanniana AG]KAI8577515.1 hypothetical protein K450DRAFT_252049 [Umbelopsis ramanniana AG]